MPKSPRKKSEKSALKASEKATSQSTHDKGANGRISQFVSAEEDARFVERKRHTRQTESSTYRLAFEDHDFLTSDIMRGVRLQLELDKTEQILRRHGVESTVIMFGGARIPAPGAEARHKDPAIRKNLQGLSHYYEEAEAFAQRVSRYSKQTGGTEFVIATGGGPGIMEAGNKGAESVGADSIGFSMVLPNEEEPNHHITPDMCFNFHYFSIRKMHFLMRAKAAAVFPGGFGTMDELFEALTLIQMKRMAPIPFLLFGETFWRRVINFDALREAGTISPSDLDLFEFVETADEAWARIRDWYELTEE